MNNQIPVENDDEEDEIVNYIRRTKNYAKFSMSPYNRAVAEDRKEEIKKAIQDRNLQADNPIAVDENFVILSGQGRFLAIKELGLDLYYMFAKDLTIEDIRKMSDIPGVWSMEDNLNYWVARKQPAYLTLQSFMATYPWLNLSNAAKLIGKGRMGGKVYKETFNTGNFNAGNLVSGIEIAEMLQDFAKWIPGFYKSHGFVAVFRLICKDPKYDHKRMMHKMETHHSLLTNQALAEQYYALLSDIYNKNARAADRYHFHQPIKGKGSS